MITSNLHNLTKDRIDLISKRDAHEQIAKLSNEAKKLSSNNSVLRSELEKLKDQRYEAVMKYKYDNKAKIGKALKYAAIPLAVAGTGAYLYGRHKSKKSNNNN